MRPINYRENRWDYFTEIWCEDTYEQYTQEIFFVFAIGPIFWLQAAILKIRLLPFSS
jgi:hypothetical protein